MLAALILGMSIASAGAGADAETVDRGGRAAKYVLQSAEAGYSGRVERIEIRLAVLPSHKRRLSVRFLATQTDFAFYAEGVGASSLLTDQRQFELDRYVLRTGGGHVLEFVRRPGGRPFLPFSFDLQPEMFLPVCLDRAEEFLPETRFLGDTFVLEGTSDLDEPPQIPKARRVVLCDDLLVGTARSSRDIDGRRLAMREFTDDMNLDYTYRRMDDTDMERMLAAGFNYFDRVFPEQLEYLIDKRAFFDIETFGFHARPVFPELFYHPGFLGVEDFLDEPAYIYLEDWPGLAADPEFDLAAMAKRQEQRTLDQLDRKTRGRQAGLMERLRLAKIDLGETELVEPAFPIWEELYSTACYQMGAPVPGFIHEGRYRHPQTVALLNNTFRVSMPRKPQTMFRFYFSFLRGAARAFDEDWGMSIYGQTDPEVSLLGMTMAYDRGARYVWFWSSDRHHHLPFEEQLALASAFQEYVKHHPRKQRRELIRAADDAIVLPYGFTFSISDWRKDRMADLWHRKIFPINGGTMADGTPYYSVLRCAAQKMEELIDDGKEFDIVVDLPEIDSAGYARLHRVLPRARQRGYEYPRWIQYKLVFALIGLVVFLVCYRTHRIVRWVRRRRRRIAERAEA